MNRPSLKFQQRSQPSAIGRAPSFIKSRAGYTLIEMLAVMAIVGLLTGFAYPRLHSVLDSAKTGRAIGDMRAIQLDLMALETQNQPLPPTLAGVGRGGMLDPWGQPYQYTPFPGGVPPGSARVDRFGVVLNATFDLYSLGPDGASTPALTSGVSLDDVVRANDGGYLGAAWKF